MKARFVLTAAAVVLALDGLAPVWSGETQGVTATVRDDLKTAGHATAHGATTVGHAIADKSREAGHTVADSTRSARDAVRGESKKAGHTIADSSRTLGKTMHDGILRLKSDMTSKPSEPGPKH